MNMRRGQPRKTAKELPPRNLEISRRGLLVDVFYWIGHGLQGNPRPNLYSGRLRLYLSRIDYDTPQD
jgi:hypothetical protein